MLQLVYWITEREAVRKNKEAGLPKPWSLDPIFNCYHFCNVHREDDRGTKEIRATVKLHGVRLANLPKAYTAARLLNKAFSLGVLLNGGWPALYEHRNSGNKVFHVAYVVSTCGQKMDKLDYVAGVVGEVALLSVPATSCESAYQALLSIDGLGTFLAAQIVADLKNDRYLVDAPDKATFSSMGPGSKKGLDFIFSGGTTNSNYERRMSLLEELLPPEVQALNIDRQDLQNCLCEFSKYVRYLDNLPGRRRPYHG